MPVTTLEVGELAVNCYMVAGDAAGGDTRPCAVIDPGDEAKRISERARALGYEIQAVFLTHAHVDHIGGVAELLREHPKAEFACSAETARRATDPQLNLSLYLGGPIATPQPKRIIADGESFTLAGLDWRAVEIPGHEPGELVYILGDGKRVFTGDTVFAGSVGRSDFPGGDGRALVSGVRALLESLPPEAVLYPGHGPATTAAAELNHNPFLNGYM